MLLDRTYARLTSGIGFIEAPLERCVDPFVRVAARYLGGDVASVARRMVPGPLASALDVLRAGEELASGSSRYLLVPTTGPWTAFFEHAGATSDPRPIVGAIPAQLGCRTVSVYAYPSRSGVGFDVLGYTLQAPGRAGMLDAERVLLLNRGEGPLEIQKFRDPLPAEPADPATLDLDGLDRILRSLGIAAFDADSYLPPGAEACLLAGSSGR